MVHRTITWDELIIKELSSFIQKNLGSPKTNFSHAPTVFGVGSKQVV